VWNDNGKCLTINLAFVGLVSKVVLSISEVILSI